MTEIVAEAVCDCGGVVDAPEFRFDTCKQIDGRWYHYLNGERVPRHVFGTTGGMQIVVVQNAAG